ncbi:hypothetical protein HEQ62_05375 [Haematospirillum jordaniae]|uniref:Uncharacterized protein n=1 Tax=Haematospirillum jordaniae TaxID=1549855 RepID=A0A143DCL0_9PROT|nr:hypothetical protein [Haematospirillum jordaniae]AMW34406.1 hypothetical protein AY555_03495 [Haematospirillum jordaniae]NKD44619.1 hypothetical protein [Haematospirillum jordaniae]NKD57639.1 hypothetical protein [Haematospirillum jordaniae]NKD59209.1 hypothetical protein [Haematospirillum jordaniae]NKD67347.1 hypothetical protein [Haematospirillum jordaniae]
MPVSPYEGWNNAPYLPGISMEPGGGTVATSASAETDESPLSFWDFLDIVNPLQHIPLVGSLYRELTGDTIRGEAKLAGGALFFGPIGLGLAALDVGVEEITGAPIDEHVVAMFNGEDAGQNAIRNKKAAETQVASVTEKTAPPAEAGHGAVSSSTPIPEPVATQTVTGASMAAADATAIISPLRMFPAHPATAVMPKASRPITPSRIPASAIRPMGDVSSMTALEQLVRESSHLAPTPERQTIPQHNTDQKETSATKHEDNNGDKGDNKAQQQKALEAQGLVPLPTTPPVPVNLLQSGIPAHGTGTEMPTLHKASEAYRKADQLPR